VLGEPNGRQNQRKRLVAELIDMVNCCADMDELLSGRDSPLEHIDHSMLIKHCFIHFDKKEGGAVLHRASKWIDVGLMSA